MAELNCKHNLKGEMLETRARKLLTSFAS